MPLKLDRAKRDLGGEKLLAAAIVESLFSFDRQAMHSANPVHH